ncbi:jerky protein homolog-like [Daphnia magna]|uniref:jerky protein homolog-like n=1 Tax=Daphnia magna TaxID=35525 RepID=UPI001E1BAA37|nr:jerky protein homolog-like [Daphnia magna]
MGKAKENLDPRNKTPSARQRDGFKVKRVRAPLTVKDKLKVIDMLKSGNSQRKIAIEFDISKSQVQQIGKNQDEILKGVDSGDLKLSAKVTKNRSENKELDDAVYTWFTEMRNPKFRCKPLSISRAHIQARALREAEIRGVSGFSASDGWFRNWRRRYEVGASIRLFYRAMPSRTYLAYNESRKTVRGTKALKAKDRVTLVLCVNADGTCKVDPLIVGSAVKPHCFRDSPCPVPYINQKNAWVDSLVYRQWWEHIFLPAVRDWTDEPVALVMDNFSGHDVSCEDPTGQVSVFFFPPNSTSVHQPLDQGIISAVKIDYKKRMLSKFIEAYDDIERIQQLASTIKKGRKGLKVDEFLNASVGDTFMSISQCDSQPLSQEDMYDPETELRNNLLKYAVEAITMPINDPVLLELAQKLRAHILNV